MALILDDAPFGNDRVEFYFDNPSAACDAIEHYERVLRACRAALAGEPGANAPADLVAEIDRMDL